MQNFTHEYYINEEKQGVKMNNNALTQINNSENTELMIWDDSKKIEEIRKLFAPKLSDMEFKFFVGLGKASRLNPFTREIWAVKYQDNAPAQVFIGRDGYRKAAQAHSDYDFHQCDAVYENDDFEVTNGEVHHKYKLTNRGQLVGAYCIAKRHKSSRPIYVFAELKEYSTGKSLWNNQTGKPATMIKKVAESQCLRACFQDLLGGTYGEEEFQKQEDSKNIRIIDGETHTQKLKTILGIGEENDEDNHRNDSNISNLGNHYSESSNIERNDLSELQIDRATSRNSATILGNSHDRGDELRISDGQLDEIKDLLTIKEFSKERINNVLHYYKVDCLESLSQKDGKLLISQLEKA